MLARARAGGDAFQQLADEEQEDDHGRLFGGADDHGADGGDRHQHLDGERRSRERAATARRAIGTRPISMARTKA